jgi:hypothetical protein
MANKVQLLKQRIEEQKKVVANAEKALKEMRANGVEPSSKSFQNMQQNVYRAATKLTSMKTELKNVESGAEGAKKETSEMNKELQGIGKNVAWQTVSDGLKNITSQLESGARAAVNFGKKIIQSAKGSTGYADEIKTIVDQYSDMGLTTDSYQRMKNVEEFIDTPVDAILTARQRMQRAAASSTGKKTLEETLGIGLSGKNAEDLFWEVGDALLNMGDAFDKESAAQTMFGRSWRELMPLFKTGREEYEKALSEQSVLTEEQVEKLAQADDAIKSVEQQVELLKRQFWADNADKITDLLEWVVDNKDGIVAALTAIGVAFGGLKIAQFATDVGKAVNGMKELLKIGGGGTPSLPGASSGASAGGAAAGGGTIGKMFAGVKNFLLGGAGTPLLVAGAALAPAVGAMNQTWADSEAKRASRAATAATSNSTNAQFLARAAEVLVLRAGENADFTGIKDLLMGLEARQNQERAELFNLIRKYAPYTTTENGTGYTTDELMKYWESGGGMDAASADALLESVTNALQAAVAAEGGPAVEIQPEVQEGAAADIAAQIGTVPVRVSPQVAGLTMPGHANGLPFVPYDGYIAMLHRGERVMPARENKNYTYNNNTYFGSVNLHNGLEVDALAESIARNNRRKSRGFGS